MASMTVDANTMTVNQVFYNPGSTGIITSGPYQYARKPCPASFLSWECRTLFPEAVKQFCQQVERVMSRGA